MGDRKLVLIADDDRLMNRMVTFKLNKEGYKVLSAEDGRAALKTALAEDIDAAVLDIMMPFLDGIQVLKRIRAVKPTLPVLMLSAKSRREDIDLALELGANDYVTKPFDPGLLVERLKKVMGDG